MSTQDKTRAMVSDPDLRKRTFAHLRKHVEAGYSIDCFPDLSHQSIHTFLKDFPSEFSQEALEESLRVGKMTWEDIGVRQADGKCLGNSRSWVYNMMNRYNWTDRARVESDVKGSISVSVVNYGDPKASTT